MLDYILPGEYALVLRSLLDKNPSSSIDSIRSVIHKDLGAYPEELFASFEETPIASASLAQVHIATGKDGKKYAVKIQHDGLLESSEGDRLAITFIVALLSRLFKDFNYNFLTREMNQNLPQVPFTVEHNHYVVSI